MLNASLEASQQLFAARLGRVQSHLIHLMRVTLTLKVKRVYAS